jgi:hypothetical protein
VKTQTTTPAPCRCLLLCTGEALPYPTTGSVVLTVDRGRVLRIEDMGPANSQSTNEEPHV